MNENDRQELQKKPPQQNEPQRPDKRGQGLMHVILVFFLITFLMNFVFAMLSGNSVTEIAYSDFLKLVEAGQVEKVQVSDTEIIIMLSEQADKDTVAEITGLNLNTTTVARSGIQSVVFSTGPMDDQGLTNMLYKNGVEFYQPVERQSPILNFILSWIVPISLLYLMYYLIMRRMSNSMGGGMGGGMFSVGKSKAKVYDMEKSTGVTFADVAGQDEAKESLTEIVDYLHNPGKYQKIGAQQPKGALLVGPPGTGKTLLAKAVAGEAKVPFYSLSGSEFVEMFVGVGASRVRDLFQEAEKAAPCIIFIDEIDAIGKSRDNQLGSNDEREQTLNQLLAQMDGFDSNKGIIVLAATNRPEVLDKALLRPGRFDRRIIVDKPDLPGREAILKVHAKKVTLASDVDFHEIGLATSGATGADLANMVNEAALRAVRLGRDSVRQEDLMESVETVIAGKEKKDRVLNPKERKFVAYHEVGHALVTSLQKNASPVQKITIVPRTMGALGYTMNAPEEERYLMTKEELLAQIRTLLGGRAAEEVAFGAMTTGASNDIERASELARRMVTQYGMSDAFGMMGIESTQNKYLDGRSVSNCAESTNARVDEEVRGIIEACHDEAVALLKENEAALESISAYLLEHETITGKTFMELLGKVQEEKAEA